MFLISEVDCSVYAESVEYYQDDIDLIVSVVFVPAVIQKVITQWLFKRNVIIFQKLYLLVWIVFV